MTDDERFDEFLRAAAQDYHRPPETPRDAMWARIETARRAQAGIDGHPPTFGTRPQAGTRPAGGWVRRHPGSGYSPAGGDLPQLDAAVVEEWHRHALPLGVHADVGG